MVRLGICTSADNILIAQECGFEYIEMSLASIASMTDEEFQKAKEQVEAAKIKVEACNGMLPGSVRVTGPDVNAQAIHDYLDKAFKRAKQLGVEVVVFGSSAARNVPDDFPIDMAWRQIMNFLRIAEKHALEVGINIAIEPLRRMESNIINLVSEATALASIAQLPHIRVLGDTYHMAMTHEPLSALVLAGPLLEHIHICDTLRRYTPTEGDGENYEAVFAALRNAHYDKRVSIEGGIKNFAEEAPISFKILDAARKAL